MKSAEVLPAAMTTVVGTLATGGLSLEIVTLNPPVGAGAESVTVPVDGEPPLTLGGLSVSPLKTIAVGPSTVSCAFRVIFPAAPDIVTFVSTGTICVATLNEAEVEPAGIVTLGGTDAAPELLERETVTAL